LPSDAMSAAERADYEDREGAETRTDLAWSRTGLALLGAAAVLSRQLWREDDRDRQILTVAVVAVVALGWALSTFVLRMRDRGPDTETTLEPRRMAAVTSATIVLAVAGLLATFLEHDDF
jgi:uncharacterized membrane protein YidH (DUF202 family)